MNLTFSSQSKLIWFFLIQEHNENITKVNVAFHIGRSFAD